MNFVFFSFFSIYLDVFFSRNIWYLRYSLKWSDYIYSNLDYCDGNRIYMLKRIVFNSNSTYHPHFSSERTFLWEINRKPSVINWISRTSYQDQSWLRPGIRYTPVITGAKVFASSDFRHEYLCGIPRVVCDHRSDNQGLAVGGGDGGGDGGEAVDGQQPVQLV